MTEFEKELIALGLVFLVMVSFDNGYIVGMVLLVAALMVSPFFGGATK